MEKKRGRGGKKEKQSGVEVSLINTQTVYRMNAVWDKKNGLRKLISEGGGRE